MKKKAKRNLYKTNSNEMEYSRVIKIAIGVIIFIGLAYLVTALITGEIKFGKDKKTTSTEASIQYEEIIAGEIFNRSNKEYYVLLFDFTDTFASYYLSIKDVYEEKDKALSVYIVDLDKKMNKEIVLDSDQNYVKNPNNYADLKVSNPTLLKIKDNRVTNRIAGRDEIINFFNDLSK